MFKLLSLKNGEKNDIYVSSVTSEKNKINQQPNENYYTLITGVNGCGKSSLLSKAANAYIFKSNINFMHGRETFDSQLEPSRIIAICNSTYNRFVPKRIYNSLTTITKAHYYLKNDVESDAHKSLQSIVIPAVKEIFARYQPESNSTINFNEKLNNNVPFRNLDQIHAIASAFYMIGIEPVLSMELEFNKSYIQFFLRNNGMVFSENLKLSTMEKIYYNEHLSFIRDLNINHEDIFRFLSLYEELKKIKNLSRLTLRTDTLEFDLSSHEMPFDILLNAILCGFITPNKIKVQRINSLKWVSIQSLSSGQQSLLINALLVSVFAGPNSLICIDEPENSLHPEWQLDFMKFIAKLCPIDLGCHFLIATHSPQIISGMKSTNGCVVSLGTSQKTDNSLESLERNEDGAFISNNQELYELSAHIRKSADRQLLDIFKTPGFHNEPLVHRLVLILTKVTKKIAISSEDLIFINEISSYIESGKIDEYDAVYIIFVQIKSMLQ